ncbi:hypothetical protein HRM2_09110 [Desulforapulum autotrophicum HRM2]|uniref:Uncharacterized protein n=1 Tax=Desulforapulum autotrophicum (strain ATCC 43914 / DSM 3382 / VKM B-1955 / HRM2) TaxID=177437 RepID=C0QKF3_DESAH|nr:hypothetical protein HRM2_09110 [Desulforapulum autotrophicum HRM2]
MGWEYIEKILKHENFLTLWESSFRSGEARSLLPDFLPERLTQGVKFAKPITTGDLSHNFEISQKDEVKALANLSIAIRYCGLYRTHCPQQI